MKGTTNTTTAPLPEWVYHEQILYTGIVALIGIPGNILIILVFACSQEKSTTDYMVFSMASSDLLGSFVCTTINILQNIHVIWARLGSAWFCRLSKYFGVLTSVCSMWLLSIVAIDRYMKTCRPHSVFFTVSRARLSCAIVCVVVATLSGLGTVGVYFDRSSGACLTYEEHVWTIADNTVVVGCCVSFLVTAIANILVAFSLCKRLGKKMRLRRDTDGSRNRAKMVDGEKNSECRKKKCERKSGDQLELSEPRSVPIDLNEVYVVEGVRNVVGSNVNEKSKLECRSYPKTGIDAEIRLEQKRVNRTTVVMFLITATNISTLILLRIGYSLAGEGVNDLGLIVGYITKTSYMANYITNPLLYMVMSSKFRDNVRKLFQRR